MFLVVLVLFSIRMLIDGTHFNGGTISWAPVDAVSSGNITKITITQSYSWSYPTVKCSTNVPISTAAYAGFAENLYCVVDCSTDGGYSTHPLSILTDCISASSSIGMMSSKRSTNVSLAAGAHFYVSYEGGAWMSLNDPPQTSLAWSIVSYIDLRKRPDGLINSSPIVNYISPQYVVVNKTSQIQISFTDANVGDDVRCRWSIYTAGYRRRKRFEEEENSPSRPDGKFSKKMTHSREWIYAEHTDNCSVCIELCKSTCNCACINCKLSECAERRCIRQNCTMNQSVQTPNEFQRFKGWRGGGGSGAATTAATANATTTLETPATLASTISYAHRQPIDECGGICYPGSVPSNTGLSNCTITFTGDTVGAWYGIAIQVEDFFNKTSTVPMSSVPVQFLVYVMPQPLCAAKPIIVPLNICLQVQVGVAIDFNVSIINLCNSSVFTIDELLISRDISGLNPGNLTDSSTNSSISYVPFSWTPEINQIGPQTFCSIAYTSEGVQSNEYCVTFLVKATSDLCVTTTTTTSTTTASTVTTTTTTITKSTTTTTTSTTTTSTTSCSTSTTSTTTTTTTTTTATTTTTSTTATTTSTTSSTSLTTTSRLFQATKNSSNGLLLFLGLAFGLGIPFLCASTLLAFCACCRWGSGRFWTRMRHRFWPDQHRRCAQCRLGTHDGLFRNEEKVKDDYIENYRNLYIRETSQTPVIDFVSDDSFLSSTSSSSNSQSRTTTQTSLLSSASTNVMPDVQIRSPTIRAAPLSFLESGGSQLVGAYMAQQRKQQRIRFN